MIAIKNILVPHDFSDHSEHALRYGVALCRQFDAELHVVHVVEDPKLVYAANEHFVIPVESIIEQQRAAADTELKQIAERIRREGLEVHTAVEFGTPPLQTTRYAAGHDVDVIVMGTHGRTGLAHFFMGSVAEKVVRTSPCPVLTVQCEGHEFIQDDRATFAQEVVG